MYNTQIVSLDSTLIPKYLVARRVCHAADEFVTLVNSYCQLGRLNRFAPELVTIVRLLTCEYHKSLSCYAAMIILRGIVWKLEHELPTRIRTRA